jgi:type I restriction enzyme S subunit
MNSEWKEITLAEAYEFKSGLSKSRDQFGFGSGFVSFKNVFYNYFIPEELDQLANTNEKEQKSCSVKRGDVFLTRTSETFNELGMSSVALKDYENATFNGFCKRLRPTGEYEIHPEYVGYYFRSSYFRSLVTSMATMTTRASLNNEILSKLKLKLPPQKQQIKIAHILKKLDDKIELNRKMNQTLESMAQALFQSWFVDFDPVLDNALSAGNPIPEPLQKKAEKRNQAEVSNKLINTNSALAKLFPSTFVFNETLNKWIPEGWELGNITEYCSVIDGDRGKNYPSQKHLLDAGYCLFLNAGNVTDSGFNFENKLFIDEIRDDLLGKGKLQKGDVIMTTRGTVGNVSFFNKNIEFENVRINSGMLIFRAKEPLHSYFINALLTSKSFKISIKNYSSGSAQPQLPIRDLKQIPVLKADYLIRDAFSKSIMSMQNKKDAQNQMNRVLSLHRDTLLPKLISGKIKILRILLTNGLI